MYESFFEELNNKIDKDVLHKNYFHFMKYAYKYKNENMYDGRVSRIRSEEYDRQYYERIFPFFEERVHKKLKTQINFGDYPLEYFKIFKGRNIYKDNSNIVLEAKKVSNILHNEEDIKNYINSLMPGTFAIYQEFTLKTSYFSKDDDEFYIIDNPILKEKVFKLPMIRGSSWKGALLKTASKLLDKKIQTGAPIDEVFNTYNQICRIFGTGSEDFRKVKEVLNEYIKNISDIKHNDNLINSLIEYALFELGVNLSIKNGNEPIVYQMVEQIIDKIENNEIEGIDIRKGRAVFYPTYFDSLTLEVIYPHSRKTKAGKQLIYFEVVPEGTKGYIQIVYIPFDAVLLPKEKIEEEIKKDYDFIKEIITITLNEYGIGAKTKLGWGLAEIVGETKYCNLEVVLVDEYS